MEKFIKLTLLRAAPLVLLFFLAILNISLYETTYAAKHDAFQSFEGQNVSLVFGNSHACYAVNSDSIGSSNIKVINMATPSQKLNEDLFILKRLINEKHVRIKSIILSIDYHSLYAYQTEGIRLNFIQNEYGDLNDDFFKKCNHVLSLGPKVIISGLKKRVSLIKYLDAETGTNNSSVSSTGFLPYIGAQKGWMNKMRYLHKIKNFNHEMSTETVESSLKIIDSICTICTEKNIQLYLFTAPTFVDYNEFLSKKQLAHTDSVINLICDKYTLSHYNYMEDTTFKAHHFYNCDHLNELGSILMAKKITQDIFKPTSISADRF